MSKFLDRITINPDILHGKPSIRNTRYGVEHILSYLAGGDTKETLLNEFKDLTSEDIDACLEYAAAMLQNNTSYVAI